VRASWWWSPPGHIGDPTEKKEGGEKRKKKNQKRERGRETSIAQGCPTAFDHLFILTEKGGGKKH